MAIHSGAQVSVDIGVYFSPGLRLQRHAPRAHAKAVLRSAYPLKVVSGRPILYLGYGWESLVSDDLSHDREAGERRCVLLHAHQYSDYVASR